VGEESENKELEEADVKIGEKQGGLSCDVDSDSVHGGRHAKASKTQGKAEKLKRDKKERDGACQSKPYECLIANDGKNRELCGGEGSKRGEQHLRRLVLPTLYVLALASVASCALSE